MAFFSHLKRESVASSERDSALISTEKELLALQQMIDSMPVNVMVAELADLKISYLNKATRTTLGRIEHLLPIKVDQMIGTSIDVFHRNPDHQRKLLSDGKNLPHTAKIKVGPEVLRLAVTPINDKDGNYIKPMLTWDIITAETMLSEEITEIVTLSNERVKHMSEKIDELNGAAESTMTCSTNVSAAATQANTNIGSMASAVEQIDAAGSEIAVQVTKVADMTTEAAQGAKAAASTFQMLLEQSSNIGNIVSLIKGIAEQTNLLALNATIEAARAGDAGKGFAVVAAEVKSLARHTATATEDIAAEIEKMQAVTGEASKAIETTVSAIREVESLSSSVAAAIEEQSTAITSTNRNIQESALAVSNIATTITTVSDNAAATFGLAKDISGFAISLQSQLEDIRQNLANFMAQKG